MGILRTRTMPIAALLAAALAWATPAYATTHMLVGRVAHSYPLQNSRVVAYATVRDSRGHLMAGHAVTFVWRVDGRVVKSFSRTNGSGVARAVHSIGRVIPWGADSVEVRTHIGRRQLARRLSFRPRPLLSSRKPVKVRIGIAGPLTRGATALGAGTARGALLAIAQYDASPTVAALGLRFEGILGDDRGDPKRASAIVARKLARDPRVLGVEGHLNSACSIAASRVYAAAGIPMITPASTNPALTDSGLPTVFRTCTTDDWQGWAAADIAWRLGYKNASVGDDASEYGGLLSGWFADRFQDDGGAWWGMNSVSSSADLAEVVSQVKSAGSDMVYFGGTYEEGAVLRRQLHDADVTATVMGGDGLFDPAYISIGGSADTSGDMCTVIGYPPSHLPNGTAFLKAYSARYPGYSVGYYDAYAYDATNVILSAIVDEARARGTANIGLPVCRRETVKRIWDVDTAGATGQITFDANGDRTQQDIAYYKVVGGQWTFQGMW